MLKKTITYTDLNDREVTETHFFHLTQADLVEMELTHKGGLKDRLQRIIDAEDGDAIIKEFKSLIQRSYGKRSEDGSKFIKNEQLTAEFLGSEAYSKIFMELVTNPDSAAEFANGIMPKSLQEQVKQERIGGAMGKPRTPAEAAALKKAQTHPGDTAAEMGEPGNLGQPRPPVPPEEQTAEEVAAGDERNVFEEAGPRILTQAEVIEMDAAELKSGLAEGRYKLQ